MANWHGQKEFAGHDGLCQETCRDTGHTQMGMAATINAAETALHQGFDLYGEETARITAAMEFHAQLAAPNAAQPGAWLCNNSVKGIGHADPTWEIAFNHFQNRIGLTNLTHTAAIIKVVRPTGVGLHMVDESLSHGDSSSRAPDAPQETDDDLSRSPARRPWVNATSNVHRFLTFDYRSTPSDIATLGHLYDFVWGASPAKLPLWRKANPDIVLAAYIPVNRDYEWCHHHGDLRPGGGRRLGWWQQHNPEWVVYQCDRVTPAYLYKDPSCVPLDISNPEVLAFQWNNCTAPAAKLGYDAIGVDNFGEWRPCPAFNRAGISGPACCLAAFSPHF